MSGDGGLTVRAARRLGAFRLDVAFEAPPTGVTVLFGASGAGKSQTLAAVAGALQPDAGRITLGEQVLFDRDARIDTPMERRAIGWVTQDGALFPHLSIEANLRYGLRRTGNRDAGVRFDEVVEMLGVGPLLGRRPAGLSGGERQRVAIGRALLSQPRLLLMDEPLAALDARRRAAILPYLERLKATCRLPILYVTHAMAEVVRLADRLVLIEEGRVKAQGSLAHILAEAGAELAGRPQDVVAVIDGRLAAHDPARGLSWIEAGPVRLATPPLGSAVGAPVRAAVLAGDVMLARETPRPLSARNVIPARIETLSEGADGVVLARLRLPGGAALWSALTRDAVAELALASNVEVFAILKSVTVQDAPDAVPSRFAEL